MIKELIKLANHLDSKGLVKEANALDSILIKISQKGGGKISELQKERNTDSLLNADEKLPMVENPATGAYQSRGCRGSSMTPYCVALRAFSGKIQSALTKLPELKKAARLSASDINDIVVAMWNSMIPSPTNFNGCFVKGGGGPTGPNCERHTRYKERGISYQDIDKLLKAKSGGKLNGFRPISGTRADDERSVTDYYGKSSIRMSGSDSDYGLWIKSINHYTKASSITEDAKKGELKGSIMWDGRDFRHA